MNKKKIVTIITIFITIILAGIAVFTAIRLYQLRKKAVAPTTPESKPQATAPQTESCTPLSFSTEPTISPTATPTPIACDEGYICTQNIMCKPGYVSSSAGRCGSYPFWQMCLTCVPEGSTPTLTPTPTDILEETPTPTPTEELTEETPTPTSGFTYEPTSTPIADGGTTSPTSTPEELPVAGVSYPTIVSLALGILTILGSLLLAL